jgi:hypothetical protein
MIASAFLNRSMPATRRVPGFRPAVMPFLGTVWMVCLPLAVSPLPAQPAVAVRRGTVEWSVGGGTADERITVTRVVGLAVSAAGQLFVADGDNAHIVVYPPGGGAPTVIGRAGGGPGEFRRLGVLAVHRQQLLVRDEGSMRLHRFALAGAKATYAGSVPLPELLAGAGRPLFLLPDGSSYEEGLVVHHRDGALRPSRLHRGANGKILREDTLVVPPGADEGVQKTRIPQRDATGAVVGVSERTLLLPFGAPRTVPMACGPTWSPPGTRCASTTAKSAC